MKLDRMFSSVVLPAPVPPDTMMFSRAPTAALQEVEHRLGQRLALDQIVRRRADRCGNGESTSHGPSSASGGMIDVDTRAVLQPRIDHRRRLVDAPADGADDALDDLHQVLVVAEDDVGVLEASVRARCTPATPC